MRQRLDTQKLMLASAQYLESMFLDPQEDAFHSTRTTCQPLSLHGPDARTLVVPIAECISMVPLSSCKIRLSCPCSAKFCLGTKNILIEIYIGRVVEICFCDVRAIRHRF